MNEQIENLKIYEASRQLKSRLVNNPSPRSRIFHISEFISLLLNASNTYLLHAFIQEFLDEYINLLKTYSPYYLAPEYSETLLEQFQILKDKSPVFSEAIGINEIYTSIREELESLKAVLNGNRFSKSSPNQILFPVVEDIEILPQHELFGYLESVSISIEKNKKKNSFIIIPSEKNIDHALHKQIELSFEFAKKYLNGNRKDKEQHYTVIIQFNGRYGNYSGSSLGIALTLGCLEVLAKIHNSSHLIKIHEQIALTGSHDEYGDIERIPNNILFKKIEICFYSPVSTFIIPKGNEPDAKLYLEDLQKKYPLRKLKLIDLESIADLLDRRTLLDIRKQNPFLRGLKSVSNSWPVTAVILILLFIVGYFVIVNYDDNPAMLSNISGFVVVKNKSGKVLWRKKVEHRGTENQREVVYYEKLFDIDDDGKNEVVLTDESFEGTNEMDQKFRIACFNYRGELLWKYFFRDTVRTKQERLSSNYGTAFLIDSVSIKGKKVLFLKVSNLESFASALFQLDMKTGNRLQGTLWHAGHITGGFLSDAFRRGEIDIFFCFANNSYEKSGFGIVSVDSLDGYCPSTMKYRLLDFEPAHLKQYLLVENSDYNKYLKFRTNIVDYSTFWINPDEKSVFFSTKEGETSELISYNFPIDFKSCTVNVTSSLGVRRDSLVVQGIISYPLTDTPEYRLLMKKNILFWEKGKFVKKFL